MRRSLYSQTYISALLLCFSLSSFAKTSQPSPSLWGFQSSETFKAQNITEADSTIVIAIIDTGADTTHPMLQEHLWVNPGESGLDANGNPKASNQVDDDNNGYVDDVNGWNFADNSNKVADTHGHGTHIAGIVARGAPKASLMILKYFNVNATGEINQQNTVKAIEYAMKMKARIINYSAGGTDRSAKEEQVIARAAEANILFVAAAGNERANSDHFGFFPASYDLPNIIAVTAVDPLRDILPSSNYGRRSVDIAAPGKMILSAAQGGKESAMTGTSQATAFVTAAAALVMAENSSLRSPEQIIPYLTNAGTFSESLMSKTKSGAQLNTYQSVVMKGSELTAFGHCVKSLNGSINSMNDFSTEDELPFAVISEGLKQQGPLTPSL